MKWLNQKEDVGLQRTAKPEPEGFRGISKKRRAINISRKVFKKKVS